MSEMREKLHTGELYLPNDEEIMKEQVVYQDRLCDYNMTKPSEVEKRTRMLKEMLAECGERGDKGYSCKCCCSWESVQGDARNWGT